MPGKVTDTSNLDRLYVGVKDLDPISVRATILNSPARILVTFTATMGEIVRHQFIDDSPYHQARVFLKSGTTDTVQFVVEFDPKSKIAPEDITVQVTDSVIAIHIAQVLQHYVPDSSNLRIVRLTESISAPQKAAAATTQEQHLRGQRITLDPGHGGGDPGAVSTIDRTQEKDITLKVCLRLETLLKAAGAEVFLTHRGNTTTSDADFFGRVVDSDNWGADFFLSVHCNSIAGQSANGYETYLAPVSSATQIVGTYHPKYVAEMQKVYPHLLDRGIKRESFYVLTQTASPAMLVELGFVNNPEDLRMIKDIETIAQAMSKALITALSAHR
jgi:N-acetylmuramoyl-L-alanine amidase